MNVKNCRDCKDPFFYADGEEWKTICIPCFKKMKNTERSSSVKFKAETQQQEKIVYRDRIVYKEKIIEQKIPPELLNRLIRLCHPDKHKNSETSNDVTKWLLEQRGSNNA